VVTKVRWAAPCLLLIASEAKAQDAVDLAARLIGRPYVWGAEGPGSFDCSGLTQFVYREVGVTLPRRAISQSTVGEPAGRSLQRGDLLFFATDARRRQVTHVGIYEGRGVMIEASKRHGRVRRSTLSEEYWIDRFMFARRVERWAEPTVRSTRGGAPPRRPDQRRLAIEMLRGVAGVLLERARER
jgi:hypothetical protein